MRLIGYTIALGLIVWLLMNKSGKEGDAQGVIPQEYQQSLQKADEVEQVLQDSLELRAREIEQSEN